MEKIRIGVIGLNFGQQHVRTLANMADAELVAVAERNPRMGSGLAAFAEQYHARAYLDGVEMIENERLDAVSVCTPPSSRAALIEAAGRKGIAMFIEKPWATNVAHAHQLAELCERSGIMVMVAFSFRFHPAIVKLRQLMDGELGPAWMLNGEYVFNWTPAPGSWLWNPADGNGFFNENSCHLFDAVRYLLGDPISVMAEAINPLGCPSEHAAAISLHFASGAIAALTVGGIGAGAYHDSPRIDVITAQGQARLSGRDHIWEQVSWTLRDSSTLNQATLPAESLGETRYTRAFQHFFECIRSGQKPSVGIEDGIKTVALAMAIYESARTGTKVPVGG
jgi:predicted dehydrogenase